MTWACPCVRIKMKRADTEGENEFVGRVRNFVSAWHSDLCWLVLTTSETPDLTCYDFSYVSRRNRHPNIRGPAVAPHKSAALTAAANVFLSPDPPIAGP